VDINNGGSKYAAPPVITFLGGCTTEPTAVSTLDANGSVIGIFLTSVGSGCTTNPLVSIPPPTVPTGTQAFASAFVTNATVMLTFTEPAGQINTSPNQQTVFVLPSRFGIDVHHNDVVFGVSPTNVAWLDDSADSSSCHPAVFNPTQDEPGFFNGCSVTFTPNAHISSLPPGTYYAWIVMTASGTNPLPQPASTMVLVKLVVTSGTGSTCGLTITNAGSTSVSALPNTGTSNSGYYPSTPISLTVTPSPSSSCPAWTAVSSDTTFVTVVGGSSGAGVGTVTFNAYGNTHLSARTATITVTAGTTTATYTISETASTDSQLFREVRALYQRGLGREPDSGGFNYWTCLTPATVTPCANLGIPGLGAMVDSFLTSPEGTDTDFQVIALYKSLLGRFPSYAEWIAALGPYILNDTPTGWLQASTTLASTLANSNEFASKYGTVTNPANVVNAMFQNSLGRAPTGAELAAGQATIVGAGTSGVYAELFNIWGTTPLGLNPTAPPLTIFTNTAYQATTNSAFIDMLYFAVLGRDADSGG